MGLNLVDCELNYANRIDFGLNCGFYRGLNCGCGLIPPPVESTLSPIVFAIFGKWL